ncbi:hypothetical protein [Cystobacter ferrugineus]|uniref:Uncharacterized protein n=1 Tax=Cystobacter ferrugineus TaxID=83449 RepID=A0A1L9BBN6_9BACT|nr:hypothetical protein [Cystobacter ferrugineus]OJH39682.1 hypothetical protein BON30_19585 [Cystobacter ferrugineus]
MKKHNPRHGHLAEVWGDTVDLRHLAWSIGIGLGVSLSCFLLASHLLADRVGSAALARAYAMLAGLVGCVLSGVICGALFPPKREVVEDGGADPSWRQEVLNELASQSGGLGAVSELPPPVVSEMKALHLYELFANVQPVVPGAAEASSGTAPSAQSEEPMPRVLPSATEER